MKQFEHEVLTFETSTQQGIQKMQVQLREWGMSGFEIVAVAPITVGGSVVTVFLKRQIIHDVAENHEEAS